MSNKPVRKKPTAATSPNTSSTPTTTLYAAPPAFKLPTVCPHSLVAEAALRFKCVDFDKQSASWSVDSWLPRTENILSNHQLASATTDVTATANTTASLNKYIIPPKQTTDATDLAADRRSVRLSCTFPIYRSQMSVTSSAAATANEATAAAKASSTTKTYEMDAVGLDALFALFDSNGKSYDSGLNNAQLGLEASAVELVCHDILPKLDYLLFADDATFKEGLAATLDATYFRFPASLIWKGSVVGRKAKLDAVSPVCGFPPFLAASSTGRATPSSSTDSAAMTSFKLGFALEKCRQSFTTIERLFLTTGFRRSLVSEMQDQKYMFFLGNSSAPTKADCYVYGVASFLLHGEFPAKSKLCALQTVVRTDCPTLVQYVEQMRRSFFEEYGAALQLRYVAPAPPPNPDDAFRKGRFRMLAVTLGFAFIYFVVANADAVLEIATVMMSDDEEGGEGADSAHDGHQQVTVAAAGPGMAELK